MTSLRSSGGNLQGDPRGTRIAARGAGRGFSGFLINHTPYPPINLHEYQKKRLTEIAFRKRLILKGVILVVSEGQEPKINPKKEKREQAPALQLEFYTVPTIPWDSDKSRKTLA